MKIKDFLFGGIPPSNSPAEKFNKTDFLKWLRNLVILVAGAAVSVAVDAAIQLITGTNFGEYQWLISFVVSSGGLEALRRYIADNMPKPKPNISIPQ